MNKKDMKQTNNPLTLSALRLNAYDDADEMAESFPAAELFDERHDFCMGPGLSALAVLMAFTNERYLTTDNAAGIRRQVSVTLADFSGAGHVVDRRIIRVNIPRGEVTCVRRVDFPFAYSDINPLATYMISVRDESGGKVLGNATFRMFDKLCCGKRPDRWYEAVRGGIFCSGDSVHELFRCLDVSDMECCKLAFHLETHFKETPDFLPEVEVRIYFPDGTVESRFRHPVCDDFDMGEYHVEVPFFVNGGNRGICYAEALCMDYAFAGFAFGTSAHTVFGHWRGRSLEPLEEYSLQAATERLRTTVDDDGSEINDLRCDDKDEFEQALDRFISSEEEAFGRESGDDGSDRGENTAEEDDGSEDCEDTAEGDGGSEDCEDTAEGDGGSEGGEDTGRSPEGGGGAEAADACPEPLTSPDQLTGLRSVKEKLEVYGKMVRFNRMRRDNGLPAAGTPLHAMFLGSPGTGKTTVAGMMGRMLAGAGMLSKGHVVVRERSTLVGIYYGTAESNTREAIEEAQGGILLIDEAYQLCQPDDGKDPGRFVIETLMTALADESRRDWMLILAGYPDEMRRMFGMNPGLRSRIPESNIYTFDDFTGPELMEIAVRYLERHRYSLSDAAREALSARLEADASHRDRTFGNARHVVNMIQTEILPAMAVRVTDGGVCDGRALSEIQACDIPMRTEALPRPLPRIGFCA